MSKQTMGKDDNGTFHPGKGKPSGANKEEGLGFVSTPPEKLDEYLEMTEKYTLGADELEPSVRMRHPNRNTSKGEGNFKGKENTPASDKTANETFTEERTEVEPQELPGILTKDIFRELANYKADCAISIFLDTHNSGEQVNNHFDPINFKNQLQEVERRLGDKGHDQGYIERLLKPGYDLLRNFDFWMDLTPGMAIFIAEGYFKYIKMPVSPVEALTVIEPTFYVTPLIPLMTGKAYFYILVIAKKCAKLYRADAWDIEEVKNVKLPQSVDEVKGVSGLDATTFRAGGVGARGPVAATEANYHGIAGGNPTDKDNILTYFEAVDDALWDQLMNKENAPLLLAGVEYEIPLYRKACDYHNVWPEALTGNRERQDKHALYKDAMNVMKPYFEQNKKKALELYMNNSATSKTTSIVEDIVPAAYYSQISCLFVAKGAHIWGTFDEVNNKTNIHNTPDEGGEHLIDNTVEKTLANGGDVYLLEKEEMPADAPMAAILRY